MMFIFAEKRQNIAILRTSYLDQFQLSSTLFSYIYIFTKYLHFSFADHDAKNKVMKLRA